MKVGGLHILLQCFSTLTITGGCSTSLQITPPSGSQDGNTEPGKCPNILAILMKQSSLSPVFVLFVSKLHLLRFARFLGVTFSAIDRIKFKLAIIKADES